MCADGIQDSRDHDRHMDGTTSAWSAHGGGVVRLGVPVPVERLADDAYLAPGQRPHVPQPHGGSKTENRET